MLVLICRFVSRSYERRVNLEVAMKVVSLMLVGCWCVILAGDSWMDEAKDPVRRSGSC